MAPILLILFLVVPLAELAVIVQVSDGVGLGNTLGLLIVVSVVGAWLVKREGLGAWRRVQEQLAAGRAPAAEVVDGVMILVAGALLLTPGFLTDTLGFLLLLPPTRALLRSTMRRRIMDRVMVVDPRTGQPGQTVDIGEAVFGDRSGGVVDVDEASDHDPDRDGDQDPQ